VEFMESAGTTFNNPSKNEVVSWTPAFAGVTGP
jgi:hypothetical protein